MTIGERIKRAREAHKPRMTQRKLSELSTYSIQSISDWECGRYEPSERAIKALEEALGTKLREEAE